MAKKSTAEITSEAEHSVGQQIADAINDARTAPAPATVTHRREAVTTSQQVSSNMKATKP